MKIIKSIFFLIVSLNFCYSQNYIETTTDGKIRAKSFIYNTPKVNYYSVDESQFVGTEGGTILRGRLNGTGGAFFYTNPNAISWGMFAPLNLPNGCKITKITAHCDDTSVNYNLNIKVSFHDLVTGNYIDVSSMSSSGSSGYSAVTNTNVNHIVDNIDKSYQVLVTVVDLSNNNYFWQGYFTVIRGVTIEYTLDESN